MTYMVIKPSNLDTRFNKWRDLGVVSNTELVMVLPSGEEVRLVYRGYNIFQTSKKQ